MRRFLTSLFMLSGSSYADTDAKSSNGNNPIANQLIAGFTLGENIEDYQANEKWRCRKKRFLSNDLQHRNLFGYQWQINKDGTRQFTYQYCVRDTQYKHLPVKQKVEFFSGKLQSAELIYDSAAATRQAVLTMATNEKNRWIRDLTEVDFFESACENALAKIAGDQFVNGDLFKRLVFVEAPNCSSALNKQHNHRVITLSKYGRWVKIGAVRTMPLAQRHQLLGFPAPQ